MADDFFTEQRSRNPRVQDVPMPRIINLFVPQGMRGYEQMMLRAENEPVHTYRIEHNHRCADGAIRKGIWVPLSWWQSQERGGAGQGFVSATPLPEPSGDVP